ncbi:MAG: NAD-dependent malic enzyme, partial [Proteobacteria bacterium]|nr:NAD-dependent malic enzyme [Pseudomonadota bacterium]
METFERPSAGYSVTLRLKIPNKPGSFARVCDLLGSLGASLAEVALIDSDFAHTVRDVTVSCRNDQHSAKVVEAMRGSDTAVLLSALDDTFELHRGGKIEVISRSSVKNRDDLSRAYTPGVARVCLALESDPQKAFTFSMKGN